MGSCLLRHRRGGIFRLLCPIRSVAQHRYNHLALASQYLSSFSMPCSFEQYICLRCDSRFAFPPPAPEKDRLSERR